MPRLVGRFGAGRSAKSTLLMGLVVGGTAVGASGGRDGGSLGSVPGEVGSGIATRALHSTHVRNLAPACTLASGTRLRVPQAGQVASIIQGRAYPGGAGLAQRQGSVFGLQGGVLPGAFDGLGRGPTGAWRRSGPLGGGAGPTSSGS